MTTDQKILKALKAIAAIPLWGEPIINLNTEIRKGWLSSASTT